MSIIQNVIQSYLWCIPLYEFETKKNRNRYLYHVKTVIGTYITPSERITLRDTTPPAAIVLIENTMPSS